MANKKAESPKFRKSQRDVLKYEGGLMGIAAVPGSGKTFTLSHLAARLVERLSEQKQTSEQEVLVVTFSNSAVNTFKQRIARILQQERRLLPYVGYRVRTLHGLAHDIVRERPALVGLAEDFQIVDDRIAFAMKRDAVSTYLVEWRVYLQQFLKELNEKQLRQVSSRDLPETLTQLASSFISRAKEYELTPTMLDEQLADISDASFDLIRFANRIYSDYQRGLLYRGAVDFDDLIRLALQALSEDAMYLQRLQQRWVYILEDEAQDSSYLQEKMLTLLTGEKNWVRVGDPNQAINTTFTTSSPEYLRTFLKKRKVITRPLTVSGRSSPKIIRLANALIQWATEKHPVSQLRDTFYPQEIQPTPKSDGQPNPADDISNIYIQPPGNGKIPDDELKIIVRSLANWLPQNPDKTVAVLVPENNRGFKLAELLRDEKLEYEELLRSTTKTRVAASHLSIVLHYLTDPRLPNHLALIFRDVWIPLHGIDDPEGIQDRYLLMIFEAIRKQRFIEELIYAEDPIAVLELSEEVPEIWLEWGQTFLQRVQRWLAALSLPIDQLVLTIGQDLFREPSDVALCYKIAALLSSAAEINPLWRLPQFVEELRSISENQRKFIGFDDTENGFEPSRGVVTISTFHAAKGLEWDRVYLAGVNNYSFPSARDYDGYASEKWFLREGLNLDAEIIAQLESIVKNTTRKYKLGEASLQARYDYAAERLRLLYVGITRARHDLSITWNIGRFWESGGHAIKQPAEPILYLRGELYES